MLFQLSYNRVEQSAAGFEPAMRLYDNQESPGAFGHSATHSAISLQRTGLEPAPPQGAINSRKRRSWPSISLDAPVGNAVGWTQTTAENRAAGGTRTRNLQSGTLTLNQLSYYSMK